METITNECHHIPVLQQLSAIGPQKTFGKARLNGGKSSSKQKPFAAHTVIGQTSLKQGY